MYYLYIIILKYNNNNNSTMIILVVGNIFQEEINVMCGTSVMCNATQSKDKMKKKHQKATNLQHTILYSNSPVRLERRIN